MRGFGIPVVVAINEFPTDTAAEHAMIARFATASGASAAVTHRCMPRAAPERAARPRGRRRLRGALVTALRLRGRRPVATKIEKVAMRVYGAEGVDLMPAAQRAIGRWSGLGFGRLPVCMAKTHLSLFARPRAQRPSALLAPAGARRDPVRGGRVLVPLCGDIMTMPGLPSHPAAAGIDIDEHGNVTGLF